MTTQNQPQIWPEIEKLIGELPAISTIKAERGTPRLFVNGKEVYPLLAWSWGLVGSAPIFKQAGINLLHPILGLNAAWPEPETYDWSEFDDLFARLLAQNPQAFFIGQIVTKWLLLGRKWRAGIPCMSARRRCLPKSCVGWPSAPERSCGARNMTL
ncbi:hypothetical protein L0337_15650 [candidate division KSB1 bacterium]|nr:hypothetical protein [candidate division KSB1 bacterium]